MIAANAPRRASAFLLAALAAGCVQGVRETAQAVPATDSIAVRSAIQTALESNPSGTAQSWEDSSQGVHGSVLPTRTYRTVSGLFCREYTVLVVDGGATDAAQGTACRDSDGVWKDVG